MPVPLGYKAHRDGCLPAVILILAVAALVWPLLVAAVAVLW